MNTYTLIYANIDDATATRSFTITAQDERWAMQQAHDILTEEPGNSAWQILSITEVDPAPATDTNGITTTTEVES